MNKLLVCAIAASFVFTNAMSAEKDAQHPHWGYEGKGSPEHWAQLQPEFATCGTGKEQSPIDIHGASEQEPLPPIAFNYAASPAEIVNNGHTIQVNLQSGGTIKLASGEYKLVQFHFHAPSEEKIAGKNYPLVAHLVHRTDDGKLAVVAVLFKEGKKDNPALAEIFEAMPSQENGKVALGADFNPADLLPSDRSYYSFIGSLTTPPCSEGVQWQVLKSPAEVSAAQLKTFRKLYRHNARPVQPLNGRVIRQG
jgi:carbonic anhydrase